MSRKHTKAKRKNTTGKTQKPEVVEHTPSQPRSFLTEWKWDLLIIAGILLVALFFRLHNIESEAPWNDEVKALYYFDSFSLSNHISQTLDWEPTGSPLQLVLFWFWGQWFLGPTVISFRLLTIIQGIGSIAVIYVIGKRVAGTVAGVTSSLLLAVSQTHIFYSQELRPYPLMLLLAALSSLALIELLRQPNLRSPWLAINVLANAALLLTHIMNWTILVVQGIALWVCQGKKIRFWVSWGVLQLLAVMLQWLVVIRHLDPDAVEAARPPDLSITRTAVYEVLRPFTGFLSAPDGNSLLLTSVAGGWPSARWVHLFFGGLGLLAFGGVIWQWIRKRRDGCVYATDPRGFAYIVIWMALPAALLFILSSLWWHMFNSRYIIHCALAASLLAGYAVTLLPKWWLRMALAVFLVVISGSHAWISPPIRPLYADMFATIREENPRIPAYVAPWNYMRTLDYNWRRIYGNAPQPEFVPVETIDKVPSVIRGGPGIGRDFRRRPVRTIEERVSGNGEQAAAEGDAWVIYHNDYEPPERAIEVFEEAKIDYEHFGPDHTHYGVFLYRIRFEPEGG